MYNSKPVPLFDQQPRPRCPVCGETSYSAAGIHPQCAVRRLDNERMKQVRLRAAQGRPQKLVLPGDMSPWKRVCPICTKRQHCRNKDCDCGHVFSVRSGVRDQEGEDS